MRTRLRSDLLDARQDLALAQAKLEGHNAYQFFTAGLKRRISDFVAMETQLTEALERNE